MKLTSLTAYAGDSRPAPVRGTVWKVFHAVDPSRKFLDAFTGRVLLDAAASVDAPAGTGLVVVHPMPGAPDEDKPVMRAAAYFRGPGGRWSEGAVCQDCDNPGAWMSFVHTARRLAGEHGLRAEPAESGVLAVVRERTRQIGDEGWGSDHDDRHTSGELARAAMAYLMSYIRPQDPGAPPPDVWPWAPVAFKPRPKARALVKAAALLAAEYDRVSRAELRAKAAGRAEEPPPAVGGAPRYWVNGPAGEHLVSLADVMAMVRLGGNPSLLNEDRTGLWASAELRGIRALATGGAGDDSVPWDESLPDATE